VKIGGFKRFPASGGRADPGLKVHGLRHTFLPSERHGQIGLSFGEPDPSALDGIKREKLEKLQNFLGDSDVFWHIFMGSS
jgi:hypothetical protein